MSWNPFICLILMLYFGHQNIPSFICQWFKMLFKHVFWKKAIFPDFPIFPGKNKFFPFPWVFSNFPGFFPTLVFLGDQEIISGFPLEYLNKWDSFGKHIWFGLGSRPKSKNRKLGWPENLTCKAKNKYTVFIFHRTLSNPHSHCSDAFNFFQFVGPCHIKFNLWRFQNAIFHQNRSTGTGDIVNFVKIK